MSLQPIRRGPVGNSLKMSQRVDSTTADVGGVLEADKSSSREVLIDRSDLAFQMLHVQKAAVGHDGSDRHAAQGRRCSAFEQ